MALSLNYHHLYYFFAIAKSGSIARAAEELSLTPPTLSSQVKQFEKAVKRQLFDRNDGTLRLTAEGQVFFSYAKKMFALGDQLEDRLRDNTIEGAPSIQIGIVEGTPSTYTSALAGQILKSHPTARLTFEEAAIEKLTPKVGDLRLDLMLGCGRADTLNGLACENRLVGEVPIVFVRARSTSVGKTPKGLFILAKRPGDAYRQTYNFLQNYDDTRICEVPDRELAVAMALRAGGHAAVDLLTAHDPRFRKLLTVSTWAHKLDIREPVYLVSIPRRLDNPVAKSVIRSFHFRLPRMALN